MKKNVCAGEVTDKKCMNVAEQNANQSWKVNKLLLSSYPINWWEFSEKGEIKKQLSSSLN